MGILTDIGAAFLELWQEAAVWLLLGLVVAGLLHTFVKSERIGRHLSGTGPWPAIKAALLGTPLPLCSCGVIPAAIGLRRGGASKSATTAFLISTPETGVDSIAISYALLGPFMTVIRPIAALCSALTAAMLVLLGERRDETPPPPQQRASTCGSCCGGGNQRTDAAASMPGLGTRLWQGQRYAFTSLLGDLSLWLVVGLLASAMVVALVPNDALAELSQGPGAMLVMALIGVPMYICASASTPLAAGLLLAGVSPGAVLVFLLAGPATNLATLGLVRRELGTRALAGYLTGVIGVAIAFGYLTNALIATFGINIQGELGSHTALPEALSWAASILLAVLVLRDLAIGITRRLGTKRIPRSA
ncbi:SO_0444 family Cu/Zn efflux transporter [Larsenimonas suaedae]|uniref:SO_0444 family Cu/Zn efflux transporter n=1 Tax=Larsenimonas suaedae TaxID=1851019 RepID=A0ABU1GZP5_9GAMM|nr:SO_0444 family Cu/Zn efflux transporter [Larsenimonas suaedae]MCM2971517.1 SO_0444 family Cu/Zn efflux transporter [Larsenimonas suaedae]MDR5896773.1 SO_0444 family Cu/Zn efflux transporter [Larsenimonas suaedae]